MTSFFDDSTAPAHAAEASAWDRARIHLLERLVGGASLPDLLPAIAGAVHACFPALGVVIDLAAPVPSPHRSGADRPAPLLATAGRTGTGATVTVHVHPCDTPARAHATTSAPIGSVALVGMTPEQATPWHGQVLQQAAHLCALAHEHARVDVQRAHSEQLLRQVTESTDDVFFVDVVDADGRHRIEYVSPSVHTLLGITPEALYQDPSRWMSVLHPDDRPRVATQAATRIHGVSYDHAYRVVLDDGTVKWLQVRGTPIHDPDVRVTRFVGCARDVTAQRSVDEALRDQQAMFAGIVGSAMDAIISVDDAGRIVVFNTAAERIFQVSAAEAIGGTLERFLPESERGRHAGHMQRFADTGVTTRSMGRQNALRAVRADGSSFPIEATISRTQVDGRPLLTVILRDVSAREQLEQQLRQGQKMEAMGHLAGGVAHDFNNLLTVILSGVDQARLEVPEGDAVREELDQVLDAARRAAGLTRQLLAFSRKQVLQLQPVDLGDVMRGIERLLRRVIGEDITLIVECPAHSACVRADVGQLEQVLVNLCVNARDAMPYGGSLRLHVQNVRRRDLPLVLQPHQTAQAAHLPDELVLLTVADSGLGMDRATLSRVFEPFFTTKESGRGTGLGLSTVYGIVEQSGGAIAIESQPERGTSVSIALPRHAGATGEPGTSRPQPHIEQATGAVLVVEDDDAVRSIVCRTLTQAGYVVTEARNTPDGRHRWDLARSAGTAVDLVITDLVMPGGSGRDLADALRGDRPDVPVLFMSGYAADRLRLDDDPEITGFLAKPFTTQKLLSEVQRLLRTHRP